MVDTTPVDALVNRGAKNLGLRLSDPRVVEAMRVGREAFASGYDTDTAYMIARQVLLGSVTQPTSDQGAA